MEGLFFYLFGTLSVIGALLTVTRRDAVTSAFWLIFTFLCVACLFGLLSAHFLAILQILLYAGAIMVFFLFVTMFLGKDSEPKGGTRLPWFVVGMATVLGAGLWMTRLVSGEATREFPEVAEGYGSVEQVSELLLTDYMFAFEVTGLLLTVAVIGAVHLARREAAGSRGAKPTPTAQGVEHAG